MTMEIRLSMMTLKESQCLYTNTVLIAIIANLLNNFQKILTKDTPQLATECAARGIHVHVPTATPGITFTNMV